MTNRANQRLLPRRLRAGKKLMDSSGEAEPKHSPEKEEMRIAWASLVAVGMVLVTIGCVTDHRRAQLVFPSTPKLRVSSIGIPGTYESSDGWLYYQLRLLPGGSGWIGFSYRLDPKETYVKPIEWNLSSDGFIELSGEGVAPAMGITAVPITLTRDGCCTWLEVTFFGVHANYQKWFYHQSLRADIARMIEENVKQRD